MHPSKRLTEETLARLMELAEGATPRDADYTLDRYKHGGGRAFRSDSEGGAKLIADLYHEEDRELFAALSPETVAALVREVVALRSLADAAREWLVGGSGATLRAAGKRMELRRAIKALDALNADGGKG